MKMRWNNKEIALLDVHRIDNAAVGVGDIRLRLIGYDLTAEILTSDKGALCLIDSASCEITRCEKQPIDCESVFKKYPRAVSPFGWKKECFTRRKWADYPHPDHAWFYDIAECEIKTGKTTFRALVVVCDTDKKTRRTAACNARIRKEVPASQEAQQKKQATPRPSAELEAEIIRILARDFTHLKARPTASEFYQEYVIRKLTMASIHRERQTWSTRTMKKRKADINAHLTKTLGIWVDVDELRIAERRSGRLVPVAPSIIEAQADPSTMKRKYYDEKNSEK